MLAKKNEMARPTRLVLVSGVALLICVVLLSLYRFPSVSFAQAEISANLAERNANDDTKAPNAEAAAPLPANVPIGTVIALAGEWPPAKTRNPTTGIVESHFSEDEVGWLECNGRRFHRQQFPDLFRAIGYAHGRDASDDRFYIPDYIGRFLRGVDTAKERDKGPRNQARAGGNSDGVGSIESYSTALPNLPDAAQRADGEGPFVTDRAADHNHNNQKNGRNYSIVLRENLPGEGAHNTAGDGQDDTDHEVVVGGSDDWAELKAAGAHDHAVIKGGNPETRPYNGAIHWVIKFRN